MGWAEVASKEEIRSAHRFVESIKNGTSRKRILPNSAEDFDDFKTYEKLEKKPEKDLFEEVMKEANAKR